MFLKDPILAFTQDGERIGFAATLKTTTMPSSSSSIKCDDSDRKHRSLGGTVGGPDTGPSRSAD
jgi:hypothetical protein